MKVQRLIWWLDLMKTLKINMLLVPQPDKKVSVHLKQWKGEEITVWWLSILSQKSKPAACNLLTLYLGMLQNTCSLLPSVYWHTSDTWNAFSEIEHNNSFDHKLICACFRKLWRYLILSFGKKSLTLPLHKYIW